MIIIVTDYYWISCKTFIFMSDLSEGLSVRLDYIIDVLTIDYTFFFLF